MYEEARFQGTPDQVEAARRFVRKALKGDPLLEEIVLIVSELVTNVVKYTGGSCRVAVATYTDRREVRVDDHGGDTVPHLVTEIDADSEGGRGLRLVADLADRWQVLGAAGPGPHAVKAEFDYAAA